MAKTLSTKEKVALLDDPSAMAKFGNLEVVAKLIVEGYIMGKHKSPFKGSSIEFVEHRNYYPGDEIRHIDWRAFGKTGKYYIKQYEDETNLRCYLIVDASGSMGYSGSTISKFDYSRCLASALGYLLLQQRDATGLITFDTKIRDQFNPSSNAQNFHRLTTMLEARKTGGETSMSKVFERILPMIKRRSLVIIISDCFDRIEPLTSVLRQFRHSRHEVILFHVVAPEEEDFPFRQPTQFRNLEIEDDRKLVDPHQLRNHYLEQYNSFCEELSRQCRSVGADYHKLVTNMPYHRALGEFLDDRARQKVKR